MDLARIWRERLPQIRAHLLERTRRAMAEEGERAERLRAAGRHIAQMLRDDYGARRVWLFGSLAGGQFHAQSDLDLLVEGLAVDRLSEALEAALAVAPELDLVRWEDAPEPLRRLALEYGEQLA
jgi:predicted nucleotidyltransferase